MWTMSAANRNCSGSWSEYVTELSCSSTKSDWVVSVRVCVCALSHFYFFFTSIFRMAIVWQIRSKCYDRHIDTFCLCSISDFMFQLLLFPVNGCALLNATLSTMARTETNLMAAGIVASNSQWHKNIYNSSIELEMLSQQWRLPAPSHSVAQFSIHTSILWCRITNGRWWMCASGSSYATEWPPLDTPLVSKWPLRFCNDLHGQKFCIFRLCLQRVKLNFFYSLDFFFLIWENHIFNFISVNSIFFFLIFLFVLPNFNFKCVSFLNSISATVEWEKKKKTKNEQRNFVFVSQILHFQHSGGSEK